MQQGTRESVYKRLCVLKYYKSNIYRSWNIQIRQGPNFAQATAAELLWHVYNCILI